jgi:hippurate hydrolase
MLLGAAQILTETPPANGSVIFIFQPAEEGEAGGKAMVEDGLFRDFPAASVYGLHNWPGIPEGQFAVRAGAVMAAFDTFEVVVEGRGSHAAMPHQGIDPIAVSAQLYQAWQLIVSRNVNPTDSAVISVTQIHAGDSWNVLPDTVVLRGTVRTLQSQTRELVRAQMAERADLICRAFGAHSKFAWQERYPPTINTSAEAEVARLTAIDAGSAGEVLTDLAPSMASEDFAYMLQEKPGAYTWLGSGPADNGKNLHSARYDFNDALLPVGVEYWVRLAHRVLSA